jgi:hypothetical protein
MRMANSLNDGALTEALNELPLQKQTDHQGELTQERLRSAADQISAMLECAGSKRKVCGRIIQIFECEMLAYLKLSPAGHGE